MEIQITGASDDLIEIDGDLSEEWPAPGNVDNKGVLIAISNGTLLRIRYDIDGIWRIDEVVKGTGVLTIDKGSINDDSFDVARLSAPSIEWVVMGEESVVKNSKGQKGARR